MLRINLMQVNSTFSYLKIFKCFELNLSGLFMLTYCFCLGSAFNGTGDARNLNESINYVGQDLRSPVIDPRYVQYLQGNSDYGVASRGEPFEVRNYLSSSCRELDGFQKAYLEALLVQEKQQHELQLLGKSGGLNHGYCGSQSYRVGKPCPGHPLANSVLPSVGTGSFHNEQNSHFTSMMRSSMGGSGPWHLDIGSNMEGRFISSLLDEFKTNKTRSFELSDITDHIVEFRCLFDSNFDVYSNFYSYID